ncbi:DUF4263 domain-containing protein [Xanthomonas translucens pv. poae]|uniref:DUF4263 domain-containing protein n=1 Tax=Xanthomonas graminis TaxID=3390026 RepID=UPI001F388364|nr:DUF4263 domain-containing protein [Xanthomonas translucens]UKE63353.1 DUF4263 domain-containing protein [Xanthomonas translucens pv. poae]
MMEGSALSLSCQWRLKEKCIFCGDEIGARMLKQGVFHSVNPGTLTGRWMQQELQKFKAVLDAGVASGTGVDETTLLDWFRQSAEHIALLAYSTHGVVPTSVGCEIPLGGFRADFAWAAIDIHAAPVIVFIEFEAALVDTLFEFKRKRSTPYIGAAFLEGFSQIVDWCAFGQHEARANPLVSSLLKGAGRSPIYQFTLIAGLDDFANDPALIARLTWWKQNIKYGDGAEMYSFTELVEIGLRKVGHWVR